MATQRVGRQTVRPMPQDVNEKENQPPSRITKRTASVAGLFEQGKRLRRKLVEQGSEESRSADVKTSTDDFFAGFTKANKSTKNPLYAGFKEAVDTYRDGAGSATNDQLQPICDALIARISGLDLNGNPIHKPGFPSLTEIEAVDKVHAALSAPLSQSIVPFTRQQADGSAVTRHVKLEKTVLAFERRRELKQAEMENLNYQLDQVIAEIKLVQREWRADNDPAIAKAKKKRDAEKAAIRKRAETLKQQSLDEIEQAQSEARAAAAETTRKCEEFMAALQ